MSRMNNQSHSHTHPNLNLNHVAIGVSSTLLLWPGWASAATPTTLKELVNVVVGVVNLLIPLIFVIIFVFLVWKLIDAWVLNPADEQKRTAGKSYLIAAVLALVLAVSTWGIIALLRESVFG